MTVEVHLVELRRDLLMQPIALLLQSRGFGFSLDAHDLARFAEADDAGDVERSRAEPALVAAAVHLRGETHARSAAANVERTDALGPVDFVRGERREIDGHRRDGEVYLSDALHRIPV